VATVGRFPGFRKPNTTPTPDELFDVVLPRIDNLAELKVVLYVIRRTFGFGKERDRISLNQFTKGIVTRDGRRLDEGVGLSRSAIVKGLRRAVRDGYLRRIIVCPACGEEVPQECLEEEERAWRIRPRGSEELQEGSTVVQVAPRACPLCGAPLRGREEVYYALRWAEEEGVVNDADYPQSTALTGGSQRSRLGVVNGVDSQETVIQETVIQETASASGSASAEPEAAQSPDGLWGESDAFAPLPPIALGYLERIRAASNDRDRIAVLGSAQRELLGSEPDYARLGGLAREFGFEAVVAALVRAAGHARSLNYVAAILEAKRRRREADGPERRRRYISGRYAECIRH